MGLQYGNYKNTDIGTYSQRSDHDRLDFWYTTTMSKRAEKAKTKMTRGRYPVAIRDVPTKMGAAEIVGTMKEYEDGICEGEA